MLGINQIKEDIKFLSGTIIKESDRITKQQAQIYALESRKSVSEDLGARLAEVELKLSKLWNMLIEVSPATGKEKLTKFGRKFGGQNKFMLGNR